MWFLQNTLTIRCQNSLPTRFISVHSRVEDPKMLWVRDQIRESPTDSRQKPHFPRYLQLSCKAISLANFFRVQNLKSESRRDSWPKSSWKRWFKPAENGCINGKCNSFKICFLEIRKLLGLKCPKSPQISKKFIKKWRFEQFEKKIYLQINV